MKFFRAFFVFSVLPMVVGTAFAQEKVIGILCLSIIWICFEFRISRFEFFLASHSLGAFARDTVFPISFSSKISNIFG